MSTESVVAAWIDGLVKQAESDGGFGRALITQVVMQDGRTFRLTIEPGKHVEDLHRESMARIRDQIGGILFGGAK